MAMKGQKEVVKLLKDGWELIRESMGEANCF